MEVEIRIVHPESDVPRLIQLKERRMPGWNELVTGWSIGEIGSGADIELDERLQGVRLGIFPASNHVILWGKYDRLELVPEIRLSDWDHRWEPRSDNGTIDFRFDRHPLLIGRHLIDMTRR